VVFGSVYGKVEGIAYLNADTNMKIEKSYSKNLYSISKTKNLGMPLTIGPIAISLTANTRFDLPFNVNIPVSTSFNMRSAVTGLYGAGFDVGLKYGIRWQKVWIIQIPLPYADWSSNSWAHNKTVYYMGSDSKNSISLDDAKISITPTVSAGIGASINGIVRGGINAGAGLESSLVVNYVKPTLTGTAGLKLILSLTADAYIGVENIPLIGNIGHGWNWNVVPPKVIPIASWQVFKTNL
jgi:hypothetical protein